MGKLITWIIGIGLIMIFISFILGTCNDAAQVAKREYSASAMLKKYEDFKNLSAGIDKKRADIELYKEELAGMTVVDKDDKFYFQQRKSELLGIVSIHNQLCSEYNSAMSKFNYRFTNRGDLPETNMEPLPREYKPYILTLKN